MLLLCGFVCLCVCTCVCVCVCTHTYACMVACGQARDDILNGSHPVSFDKACEFAGYQCQIQFGDHNESKHKSGFLE